jgi:outer membrane protein assembly factor BamB
VAAEVWSLSDDADPSWERLGPATYTSTRSAAGGAATFEVPTLGYFAVVEAPPRIENPCGPALGFAADSPWPSARGCETGRRSTFVVGPASAPTPTWTWYDPSTIQVFGPVIDASGDLFVTSVQYLARLAPDGTERWKIVVRPSYPALGTATAPMLLANGLVLVCRYGGETMAAFHADDGSLAWESTVGCDHYTPAVPRSDGLLLVNNVLVDPDDGSVVLTAPADTCGNPVLDSRDHSYCLDAAGGLRAFDEDLVELWHSDLPLLTLLDPDFMVVEDGGVEKITAFDNAFAVGRLYPTTGPTLPGDADVPSFASLPFGESAAGSDSLWFVTRGIAATGGSTRLDLSGTAQWSSATPQGRALVGHFPSPVVDGDENVYYGTFDGQVAAVNADGSTRWVVSLGAANVRDVVVGPGGAVYAITTDAYGGMNRLRALE